MGDTTRNLASRYEVLRDVSEAASGDHRLEEVLAIIAKAACSLTGADRTTVFWVDEASQELVSRVAVGLKPFELRVPIDLVTISGYVAVKKKEVVVPDAYGELSIIDPDLNFDPSYDERSGYTTTDVAAVPIRYRGEVISVMQSINSGAPLGLGEQAMEDLRTLAKRASYVLYAARLEHELNRREESGSYEANYINSLVTDLKGPLKSFRAAAARLRRLSENPSPEIKATLDDIDMKSQGMAEMVEDLLSMNMVREGKAKGEVRGEDIGEAIEMQIVKHDADARQRNVAIAPQIQPPLPRVRFDCELLPIVFSQLLTNAIKYNRPGGKVNVRVFEENQGVRVEISDTGIGIPEADKPKLFKDFYRASNAIGSRVMGTGVGLSTVKRLVERFKGKIGVHSEENVGSTFWVWLPSEENVRQNPMQELASLQIPSGGDVI